LEKLARELYTIVETHKCGVMDAIEVERMMVQIHRDMNTPHNPGQLRNEAQAFMSEMQQNNGGQVGFQQFLALVKKVFM